MKEDASGVVLTDNENGKIWGPHALLCACIRIPLLVHDSTDAQKSRKKPENKASIGWEVGTPRAGRPISARAMLIF